MKKIKILSRFIKDISIAKKNVRYSGYKSSYFLLRFFYFLSNALLLTLIEKIIKKPIKVNKFKDGLKFEEKIKKKR